MSLPQPEGTAWLDGRLMPAESASLPLDDRGLQWGFGVFETLAVRENRPRELAEHLARLESGASRLKVPLPDRRAIESACERVASGVASSHGWLKVLATRSGRCAVFAGNLDPAEEGKPVSAVLMKWTRSHDDPLARFKTLSYAHSILASEEARERGADEGIWRNSRGHLAEAGGANLFVVSAGKLFTPSVRDGILPGITREMTLRAARGLGLIVHEGKVRLERLERAREAFLTSSVRGLRPIVRFEGRPLSRGGAGPIAIALTREVERLRSENAVMAGRRAE